MDLPEPEAKGAVEGEGLVAENEKLRAERDKYRERFRNQMHAAGELIAENETLQAQLDEEIRRAATPKPTWTDGLNVGPCQEIDGLVVESGADYRGDRTVVLRADDWQWTFTPDEARRLANRLFKHAHEATRG